MGRGGPYRTREADKGRRASRAPQTGKKNKARQLWCSRLAGLLLVILVIAELNSGRYLSPSQAARRAGVSDQLVHLWLRTGKLPCIPTPLGRLIDVRDLDELIDARARRAVRTIGGNDERS